MVKSILFLRVDAELRRKCRKVAPRTRRTANKKIQAHACFSPDHIFSKEKIVRAHCQPPRTKVKHVWGRKRVEMRILLLMFQRLRSPSITAKDHKANAKVEYEVWVSKRTSWFFQACLSEDRHDPASWANESSAKLLSTDVVQNTCRYSCSGVTFVRR